MVVSLAHSDLFPFVHSSLALWCFDSQGTLLIFKVDPHAESQDLARVFSAYGDVRRIQDVPDKKNHKLIEFYDIRHANAAMAAINKAVAAGSKPEGAVMRHVASHANIGHQYNAENQVQVS